MGAGFGLLEQVVETDGFCLLDGHGIGAAEGVAVILNEPEVVLLAEGEDGAEIKGIAQGVSHHHSLGLSGDEGGLKLFHAGVTGLGVVVDEDGHRALLENGRNRRREAGGDGDDLVAGLDALVVRQLMRGERGEGDEICGRARIYEQAVFHAKQGCEFLFEGFAFGPEGEPEIEGRANGSLNFVGRKDAACVGYHGLAGSERRPRGIVAGAIRGMDEGGILAGETEDFGFEVGCVHDFTGMKSRAETQRRGEEYNPYPPGF